MSSILLNFDIEEFDIPLEYQNVISFDEQIKISAAGTNIILDLLKKHQIKSTFFSTVKFAQHAPSVIQRIVDEGHELASHGIQHTSFNQSDYAQSKIALEELSGKKIVGFRMPRAQPVDESMLLQAGYLYDSSINPTFLPGRYNNLNCPRTIYQMNGLIEIPASVMPFVRFPLFWLSFHNLPLVVYFAMSQYTLKKDGYLNIYFHPWEFMQIDQEDKYNLPAYVVKNCGDKMINRFEHLLLSFKSSTFKTIHDFIKEKGDL